MNHRPLWFAFIIAISSYEASAEDCPEPISPQDLAQNLLAAQDAFRAREKGTVIAQLGEAKASLSCADTLLEPTLAAQFHRLDGLRAFLEQDESAATRAFAAARSIEPVPLSPELIPSGHRLHLLYESLDPSTGRSEAVPVSTWGEYRFDGRVLEARPLDWPVIVQTLHPEGQLYSSHYLLPGEPLPPLPEKPVVASSGPRLPLLGGALGGTVISGVLYGLAWSAHNQFDGLEIVEENRSRFSTLQQQNNLFLIGSGVTFGLSATAGVLAFTLD